MIVVRAMQPEDVDAVRQVDAAAFTAFRRQFGAAEPLPPRTRENVLAALAMEPAGCFIAGDEGVPAGYVFSRRWGLVGWVGVFGVQPERHGQGIGRQLLQAAVAHLQAIGCTTIGLETMPESAYNVGLYTRSGFRPAFPTMTLAMPVVPSAAPPCALLDDVPLAAGLDAVREISASAQPGLDYTRQAQNARDFDWGETLLVGWPNPWALAIVRTVARREAAPGHLAEVDTLAIAAPARDRLPEALAAVQCFAAGLNAGELTLPLNAVDWPALQTLLQMGARIERVMLRLLLRGATTAPLGIDMSRWAM